MNCIKCGKCCCQFEAWLDLNNPVNEAAIAAIKGTFRNGKSHVELSRYEKVGLKIIGPCKFFDEKTKRCLIYEDRPEMCRNFWCDNAKATLPKY